MYNRNQKTIAAKQETNVFRMIGSGAAVVSSCKATLSAAGFCEFNSHGYNFVCSRQLESSNSKLTIYVECVALSPELWEVTFQKFENGVSSLHSQMMKKRLEKVCYALEAKVA
ncbi:MAG: hypothetical protein JST89_24210 [Cyanobacteria bacterium SZAS-4]|nr:hypothetical protein [Cyanobacteria bacterium SZAS-4]